MISFKGKCKKSKKNKPYSSLSKSQKRFVRGGNAAATAIPTAAIPTAAPEKVADTSSSSNNDVVATPEANKPNEHQAFLDKAVAEIHSNLNENIKNYLTETLANMMQSANLSEVIVKVVDTPFMNETILNTYKSTIQDAFQTNINKLLFNMNDLDSQRSLWSFFYGRPEVQTVLTHMFMFHNFDESNDHSYLTSLNSYLKTLEIATFVINTETAMGTNTQNTIAATTPATPAAKVLGTGAAAAGSTQKVGGNGVASPVLTEPDKLKIQAEVLSLFYKGFESLLKEMFTNNEVIKTPLLKAFNTHFEHLNNRFFQKY